MFTMNTRVRFGRVVALLGAFVLFAGCSGAGVTDIKPTAPDTTPARVEMILATDLMEWGPLCPDPTLRLSATVYNANNEVLNTPVTWASQDIGVVAVKEGEAHAISPGVTTLVASTSTDVKATRRITVASTDKCQVPVSAVILSGIPDTLYKRATVQATAQVLPATAPQTNTWSTENAAVLTVDQGGNLTAVGVGTTRVCNTAGKIQTCHAVTVVLLPFTVSLDAPMRIYLPGSKCTPTSYTITASLPVTFLSLSPETLKVDDTGVVTPLAVGVIPVSVTERLDNRQKMVYFLIDPCT